MYLIKKLPCHDTLINEVEIYLLTLDLKASISLDALSVLTVDETEKAFKYRNHEDQIRFVSTRSALRRLLGSRLDISDLATVPIKNDTKGKPKLHNDSPLYFNVSHSGSKAFIVISSVYEVGVDIECKHNLSDQMQTMSEYFCSEEELLASPNMTVDQLYIKWVVKESVVKAIGYGLTHDMSSFSIYKKNNSSLCIEVNDEPSLEVAESLNNRTNRFEKNLFCSAHYYTKGIPTNWNIFNIFSYENEFLIAAITLIKNTK